MNKRVLREYIDACELIKETEADIRRLTQKKKTIIQTNVKGSSPEFPYTEKHFKIQGTTFSVGNDNQLRYEENLLKQRKENAEQLKLQVEEWMATIPFRIQRIVKYRYLERLTWEQVANRMGGTATADSVRMELNKFLK
ncbi:MAG: RNA polymerase subunit sigma-70 [Lachnospiraceae bacterium]|nr:RNA polymerase subunit sigma-70 [Lachnospiraceae bacterium]